MGVPLDLYDMTVPSNRTVKDSLTVASRFNSFSREACKL